MTKVTLHIHSFVDIITNSSSEIYVEATENTIKNVKTLVDSLLAIGGSSLKSDDLFELSLLDPNGDENSSYSDDYPTVDLVVKAKTIDKNAIIAAKILSSLTDIFNIECSYNG